MRSILTIIALASITNGWSQATIDYFAEGRKAKEAKNFALAIENFKKATAQKQTDGEAWYELGWCYNELTKYTDAAAALKSAKLYWKDPKVFYESGYANDYANNITDAMADYKKCLEMSPSYSAAYRELANIYFDVDKNYETALEYYNNYINYSLESEISSKTWYRKGYCENEDEEYEDAIISLKKSIQLDDKYGPSLKELGYAYYGLSNYDDALIELNKSLQYEQSNAAYYYCGLCYVAKKQKTKAQEIYKKLVEIKSVDADKLLAKINAMQ
ncbi:MAG: tetratricopeptide repeat protein [Chitinophagaceae bacterium]